MLKNYFKIACRSILKNKLFSIIDIFGLSVAVGCSIVVFLFVDFWASMDSFHKNAGQIYLIENVINRDGTISIWGDSPLPLGPAVEKDFPQIIRTIRIQTQRGVVQYKDKVFNEGFMFVDEGFFDMFTFPLIAGSKNALLNRNALFIDEGENMLLCLFALFLGAVLAKLLFIPSFSSLFDIPLKLDLLRNIRLSAFLVSMLLITSLGGSAYPAFYISGFQPANILRGKQKRKGKSLFMRILLTFQFVLTFITVATAIILVQNAKYQRSRDWGYNQNQVIVVRLDGQKDFTKYKNEISKNPDILQTAGSVSPIGRGTFSAVTEIVGTKYELKCLFVGHDYLQTMGVRLKTGRLFDRKFSTDSDQAIVINNKFVENMNWKNPLEETIVIDKKPLTIIGVVDDFHYASFRTKIEPAFFRLATEDRFNYLSIRIKEDTISQTTAYLKKTWERLIPDTPYISFFQDEIFESYFKNQNNIIKLFSFIAAITLVIASMGLFGLISIRIDKMMREISIRKVLGATIANVVRLVNKEFVIVLLISTVMATPLGYLMLKYLFDSYYEYHIPIALPPFVKTFVLITVISLMAISSLIYKVAVSNPADILREE